MPCNAQKGKDKYDPYVEGLIFSYYPQKSLDYIDSVLLSNGIDEPDDTPLKIQKVEVLIQANLYDDALLLADKLLSNTKLPADFRSRILINRSLIFEIIEDFDKSSRDLLKVDSLYSNGLAKDELYGNYLYRRSSLNRVQGNDSLYILYAAKAEKYGKKYNFLDVIANSNMLLSFNQSNTKLKELINHSKTAQDIWKKVDNKPGVIAMYLRLSNLYQKNQQTDYAMCYLDSAIDISFQSKQFFLLPTVYLKKSEIYETSGDLRLALDYYEKYKEFADIEEEKNKSIRVKEIEFKKDVETASLQNKLLKTKLSKSNSEKKQLFIFICILSGLTIALAILQYIVYKKNRKIKLQDAEIRATNIALEKNVDYKNFLLKEIQHRVKNNLALIISLVRFQNGNVKNKDTLSKLENLENRIKTIAIAHNNFIPKINENDKNTFDIKAYINTIIDSLTFTVNRSIVVNQDISTTSTTLDNALPIGIIINELVANSIKHALCDELIIHIAISINNSTILIDYKDNGKKFKINRVDNNQGLDIIDSMVQQLDGTLSRNNSHYKIQLNIKI